MFKFIDDLIGYPALNAVSLTEDTLIGTVVAVSDPTFGAGEAMYGKVTSTVPVWAACTVLPTFNASTLRYEHIMVAVANSANQARSVVLAMNRMTTGQYGWFLVGGTAPVSATASVASGTPLGVAAAGQLGAAAVGKNVLGMVSIAASSITVVKAGCTGIINQLTIKVPNVGGLFVGQLASGTGVAALAIVTAIDEIANVVTVAVANTASTVSSVTFTNNDATIHYPTVSFSRPTLTNLTV
jgi:hypothetical protein